MELRLLAIIAILLAGVTLSLDLWRPPPPIQHDALVPSGAQGKLALPEGEFKPILDRANVEMNRRFTTGKQFMWSKRAAGWVALMISASVSLIGAFYGKAAPLKPSADVADVLGAVDRPQRVVRLVCLLLAASSILSLLAQNLDAESARLIGGGRTLNESIIESTATLYDPATTEVKARVTLRKLEAAISHPQ